jgi:hypothetical protein
LFTRSSLHLFFAGKSGSRNVPSVATNAAHMNKNEVINQIRSRSLQSESISKDDRNLALDAVNEEITELTNQARQVSNTFMICYNELPVSLVEALSYSLRLRNALCHN